MTNNELLLAISDMMDQKLDTRLKPIEADIKSMKNDIKTLKEDVNALKTDVSILKNEVSILKEDVNTLKADVNALKTDVNALKADVNALKAEIVPLKEDVISLKELSVITNKRLDVLEAEVLNMKLFQENTLLPRLNTIETCYTDTYTRYKNYANKMQAAFDDIDLLKKVVSEHSKKLEQLA